MYSRGSQGDQLSPLLFCLAENVLSRNILKLVNFGYLNSIIGPKQIKVPSHISYVDDAFIFYKVIWKTPPRNWIKINCDGPSLGNPGSSACGGIARDYDGRFLRPFAHSLGVSNSLIFKLSKFMSQIEYKG
ncbi:hypothetical protein KIW84_043747 [Lathyrus oleraceus]|uniref:Uncharacterized protein n=1 Tax=Pisum sativum TaxID=3888 RepID=A0A9D4XGE5_PEA|nr:hypothetical protein KIW84_043747 [Pisum sativum]